MLLIESGKGHLAQNKSENFVGSFASWVALFPGSSFHPEKIMAVSKSSIFQKKNCRDTHFLLIILVCI